MEKLDGQRADREGIVLNVCLMYIIDTLGPDHFEQTTNSSLDPIQLTGLSTNKQKWKYSKYHQRNSRINRLKGLRRIFHLIE